MNAEVIVVLIPSIRSISHNKWAKEEIILCKSLNPFYQVHFS